ncbi:hypothetical protein AYI68_g1133 [Smittium mucronatum]|uniref:Uncharacterized protein n=1 Tax=Smittium mucronatum TaxID=133383 RepID=A0A1R0H6A2_9FUNG|nr:hypothetical protein AYI68_g1133 [Smittium mucronatum]
MFKGLFLGIFFGSLVARIQTANGIAHGNLNTNHQEATSTADNVRNVPGPNDYDQNNIDSFLLNSNIDGTVISPKK